MRTAAFVILLVSLTGCYTYVPIEQADPVPGSEVRAFLNEQGQQLLTSEFGPNVRSLDGRFLRAEQDSVTMSVEWVNALDNTFRNRSNQGIRLAATQVERIETKRLDTARSFLLGGAIVVGFALLGQDPLNINPFDTDEGDDGGEGGGAGQQTFIGLRIPLGIRP